MDMQGATVSIRLTTGQVVEFELMRVGTVAEYRRLVKDSKEVETKAQTQAKELKSLAARAVNAESRTSEAEAELAALKEAIAERKSRAAALFAKLDGGKSVLSQTLEEMIGVIGEIHES